jgi:DNA-binding NarL/FixJ family response regulator
MQLIGRSLDVRDRAFPHDLLISRSQAEGPDMLTNTNTIGINSVREAHGFRCTPATRRRHMVARHVAPASAPAPVLRSVPTPAVPRPAAPAAPVAARPARGRRAIDRLTRRQLEVLSLMAEGHSNAAIARLCYISDKAVVQHTSQIYDRLDLPNDAGLHRRVQAVVIYLEQAAA